MSQLSSTLNPNPYHILTVGAMFSHLLTIL